MEFMPDFSVLYPKTVEEAIGFFNNNKDVRYVAGGTDLVVNIRRGIVAPGTLIDLNQIEGMSAIESDGKDGYRIGAGVTLTNLIDHKDIARDYTAITQAAGEIAAATHRQVATVGGNLCLDTRCIFYNQSEWWRSANNYCLKNQGETCHVAPTGEECFAVFSGDLLHHAVQVAHPEWNSRFCWDGEMSRASRRKFVEQNADTDTLILAAHFPSPTAGTIVSNGPRCKFAPAAD